MHWAHIGRGFGWDTAPKFANPMGFAIVSIDKFDIAQPHVHGPGCEEVWCQSRAPACSCSATGSSAGARRGVPDPAEPESPPQLDQCHRRAHALAVHGQPPRPGQVKEHADETNAQDHRPHALAVLLAAASLATLRPAPRSRPGRPRTSSSLRSKRSPSAPATTSRPRAPPRAWPTASSRPRRRWPKSSWRPASKPRCTGARAISSPG